MMSKMRNHKGFTLIELMIVVAIIGILAAIAIPQFASYRQRAQDSAAKSALKNLATAQEDYYVQHNIYGNRTDVATGGWTVESTISLSAIAGAGSPTSWSATAQHTSSTNVFIYDSASGGLQ